MGQKFGENCSRWGRFSLSGASQVRQAPKMIGLYKIKQPTFFDLIDV
jgi:hypothetical protein